ncbi:hypothetical protein SAMN05661093_09545 [Kibdelosporangium aridum]|uniref:Uncharacterized protein n=1 Tax=Kibdelosporangium aridum TaxID=2030 RepID=A0A1W2FVG2_KIBAR|nr:hypothetical protein SAMN05661093_09545 [Kibdelosporangium aridum]
MVVVWGVAVSIVDVVDVVAVRDGDVSASLAVHVPMVAVRKMGAWLAVRPAGRPAGQPMEAPVVQVVDMVLVRDGHVSALRSVLVGPAQVTLVRGVPACQEGEELWCRAIVDKGIRHRAAIPVGPNQATTAKDAQVVGDQRLRRLQ